MASETSVTGVVALSATEIQAEARKAQAQADRFAAEVKRLRREEAWRQFGTIGAEAYFQLATLGSLLDTVVEVLPVRSNTYQTMLPGAL